MDKTAEQEKFDREAVLVGFPTRIDLMWEDEMTDADKIGFAEFVRDVAAEQRKLLEVGLAGGAGGMKIERESGKRIAPLVRELCSSGFVLIQTGRVLRPSEHGLSFAERVEGCNVSMIRSGDTLLDDEERWAHLRPRSSR